MNLIEFIYSHSNSLCQAENHNFKIQMLVGEKACFHFSTADQKEKEIVFRYLFYSKLKYRDCTLQQSQKHYLMLKTISISKGTTLVLQYSIQYYIVYSLGRRQERRRSKYSKGEMKFLASLECSSARLNSERESEDPSLLSAKSAMVGR